MIPRVERRRCDASSLAGASGDSRAVPHEQAAIFEENERIANAVQIERVRSTKQSGWYHKNSEEQAAIFEENERITNAVQIVRV